ncbi:MAG: N(4)-(beta-N-acetylglucosaminyl)-L-asparaginase [bacterium]|nr:MAG: N(4)-(beta-N-acetylglucosaminyl)-L-asparaginase [bacterium]
MVRVSRRNFLKFSAALSAAGGIVPLDSLFTASSAGAGSKPVVISTWNHGVAANDAAWRVLSGGGSSLDAVEAGVRISEGDPKVMSVGFGGLPDEDCTVTLDASIMGPNGNAGAVAFVQHYKHPISIARKVMEKTDHVMLVGEGAEEFARRQGFERRELLTEEARKRWLEWKAGMSEKDDWLAPAVNHDTIGMVALDSAGDLAGACTTSGLAFKIHGRVGDSPLIGAGMYVDNEVGAAAATGKGEAVIRTCGSFLVVEGMRDGLSPQKAIKRALERIIEWHGGGVDFQVAFVAVNRSGKTGALAIQKGFQYALARDGTNELIDSEYLLE